MRTYKILFTPTEPYFFGNEKTFRFDSDKSLGQYDTPYFIRSERTPSQTTVFGAIRFLLLKNRKPDFNGYPDGYEDLIGEESWDIEKEGQTFGKIKSVSPIFLYCESTATEQEEGIYLPTPLNHNTKNSPIEYTPFTLIDIDKDTAKRQYSEEYDPKEFLADSYMNITNGKIVSADKIFGSTVRVGIDTKKNKSAFFKKEYGFLQEGWSFGIFLAVDDSADSDIITDKTVYLGQNKATFKVSWYEAENTLDSFKKQLPRNVLYCASDTYTTNDIYKLTSFAVTSLRDYRSYKTVYTHGNNKRPTIKKESTLYKLLKAGSVLCFRDETQLKKLKELIEKEHCSTVGMNTIIIGEK